MGVSDPDLERVVVGVPVADPDCVVDAVLAALPDPETVRLLDCVAVRVNDELWVCVKVEGWERLCVDDGLNDGVPDCVAVEFCESVCVYDTVLDAERERVSVLVGD